MKKLSLSKPEVESVMEYIWTHCRASENGKAYKVWKKMFEFVNDDQQELSFTAARNADAIDFFQENGVELS